MLNYNCLLTPSINILRITVGIYIYAQTMYQSTSSCTLLALHKLSPSDSSQMTRIFLLDSSHFVSNPPTSNLSASIVSLAPKYISPSLLLSETAASLTVQRQPPNYTLTLKSLFFYPIE